MSVTGPARGKGLSRDKLVQAALAIVDRDGLGALSMRRLGAELGVDPMAAYRHFPSKEALLDGVVEAVVSEIDLEVDPSAPWEERLRTLARANLEAMMAHPNALPLLAARPLTTPDALRLVEKALEITSSAGIPLKQGSLAMNATGLFTTGFAAALVGMASEERTGAESRAALAELPRESFPLIHRVLETGQEIDSYEEIFDYFMSALVAHLGRAATAGR